MANGHKLIDDFNGEEMVGVGYNHTTTRGGERMSAWTSFVAPGSRSSEPDGEHRRIGASDCRRDGLRRRCRVLP